MMIIKIVIETEVLIGAQAMIDSNCKLIAALWLHRRTHQLISIVRRDRHVLEHQVNRGGIHAFERNDVVLAIVNISKYSWADEIPQLIICARVVDRTAVRSWQHNSRYTLDCC